MLIFFCIVGFFVVDEFGIVVFDGVVFLLLKLLWDDVELKKLCVEWYFFKEFIWSLLELFVFNCFFNEIKFFLLK